MLQNTADTEVKMAISTVSAKSAETKSRTAAVDLGWLQHIYKKSHLYAEAFVPKSTKTCTKMAALAAILDDVVPPNDNNPSWVDSQETAPIREDIRPKIDENRFQDGFHVGHIRCPMAPQSNTNIPLVEINKPTKNQPDTRAVSDEMYENQVQDGGHI